MPLATYHLLHHAVTNIILYPESPLGGNCEKRSGKPNGLANPAAKIQLRRRRFLHYRNLAHGLDSLKHYFFPFTQRPDGSRGLSNFYIPQKT